MKKIEEATEKETKVENVRDGKGRRGAGKEENKTRAFRPWIRRTNNTGQLWFNIADVNNNSRGGFTRSALSFSSRKKKIHYEIYFKKTCTIFVMWPSTRFTYYIREKKDVTCKRLMYMEWSNSPYVCTTYKNNIVYASRHRYRVHVVMLLQLKNYPSI